MTDPELGFFVRPDSLDFRDRIFQPTLIEVPSEIPLSAYQQINVPVLNQLGTGVATRAGVRSTLRGTAGRQQTALDGVGVYRLRAGHHRPLPPQKARGPS